MPTALKKLHDRENGFTLIELLIVVLIIGVLAAIAIPVYLGIQQQGYKSAVKSDVNLSVKRVQVAVTEGKTVAQVRANQTSYTQQSVKGEVVDIRTSPTANASADDFSVQGIVTKNTGGPVNYGYFYDSVTGKFTESEDAIALGSSSPAITVTTASLPNGVKDAAYSVTLSAVVTNPSATTTWSISGLPAGLTYESTTGVISGTPTAAASATVTATATNGSVSNTKTYALVVNALPVVTTTSVPNGLVGTSYSQTLAATGTPAPTRFDVASGSLPTGLNLSTAGVISGTPTAAGTFPFTVTATNTAGTSQPASYMIVVNQTPAITTASLNDGTLNSSYTGSIAATGAPAPTFSVTSGTFPTGLNLSSSTGAISGTPTVSGNYAFGITATSTAGSSVEKSYTVYIAPIGTAADRVPAPVTDTVFWSKMIAGKLPGYRYYGGANTSTTNGIVFQNGGNFLSVTRANLPVPASRKVQVTYSAQGMTPYIIPMDANGNFIGTGSGDGTWYVWTSGNVITLPANAVTYDVAVPNWTSGPATLSSIHVIEQ